MVIDHGNVHLVEEISISKFKATCLAVLERVNTTGEPVLVTKRGTPIAEVVRPSKPAKERRQLGQMAGRFKTFGDIISPASDPEDWEVLRD